MVNGQNVLCIYQEGNIDSFLAAWVLWKQYPNASFISRVEKTLPSDLEGMDVYVMGTTLPLVSILPMADFCNTLTIFGYEKTFTEEIAAVQGNVPNNVKLICDEKHSICTTVFDYFNGPQYPPILFHYVEDKVMWRFQFTETRPVIAALMGYRLNFEMWSPIIEASDVQLLVDEGRVVLKRLMRDIEYALRFSQRRINIGGYDVPVVNTSPMIATDAGIQLAKGEPFAACYWDTPEGREYELISTPNGVDVSRLVSAYGGHGNPQDAHFKVARNHPLAVA